MPRRKKCRLTVTGIGPIKAADIEFGNLTVLVGAQATGKSLFLQTLKLVLDQDHVHDTFEDNGVSFGKDGAAFLNGYFGKGLGSLFQSGSSIRWCGSAKEPSKLTRSTKSKQRQEKVFYIPAQRVVSLPGGQTQNFGKFNYGDPYVLRQFSDTVHYLLQNEFGAKGCLFPQANRLNDTLRTPISDHLLGGATLETDEQEFTKTIVLKPRGSSAGLHYLAWSAGQREFMPLLLGLYWLCPAGGTSKRDDIDWVVIEEPEMGLHPKGISALLLLALELLRRGYRVVISTHSPVVLEMIWAISRFKKLGGAEKDVRSLFELPANPAANQLAKAALSQAYKVYFFDRGKPVQDISALDPSSDSGSEADWGGLVGFSGRAGELVAEVAQRHELSEASRRKSRKRAKQVKQ